MRISKRAVKTAAKITGKPAAPTAQPGSQPAIGAGWTFLTNHSHVLILLSREPDLRLRDVAERVGITERAVQRIVADLEEGAIITRSRDGRRNRYEIHAEQPLRHAIEAHCTIHDLLKIGETQ